MTAFTDKFIQDCLRSESRKPGDTSINRMLHAGLGLATEAGEFLDMLKKHLFYGKEIDYENLDEEAGDLLWYLSIYLDVRGKSYREVMEANTRKLKARYPEKFTSENALNRDIETELKAFRGET